MTATQHVITIPACEVVAGMVLWHITAPHAGHTAARVAATGGEVVVDWHAPTGSEMRDWYTATQPIHVTLPGPSPRELLCTCPSAFGGLPGSEWMRPPHEHQGSKSLDCPVRRLRLRVWPAPLSPYAAEAWRWHSEAPVRGWRWHDTVITAADLPLYLDGAAAHGAFARAFCLPADHCEQAA